MIINNRRDNVKKEFKCLIYSMFNNLLIGIIKIIGGLFFNLTSLFADGLHTFSDFITDIISFIGSKISRKKPTKVHPFGFGKVEYLTNLFVGIIILILGFFIIFNSFGKKVEIPPLSVLYLLIIVFVLKLIAIIIMHKVGIKLNSQVLITATEESKADLYSTIAVAIITILLQFVDRYPFLKYADLIGSVIIGFMVLKISFKIIISNSLSIIGEVEIKGESVDKIKDFIKKYKKIKDMKVELIKYGNYYKMNLELELNPKLSLRQITNLENKIKKEIVKHRSLKVKYVEIYVTEKLGER